MTIYCFASLVNQSYLLISIQVMLDWLLPPVADYVTRNCKQFVKISPMLMVHSMLRMFGNILDELRFVESRCSYHFLLSIGRSTVINNMCFITKFRTPNDSVVHLVDSLFRCETLIDVWVCLCVYVCLCVCLYLNLHLRMYMYLMLKWIERINGMLYHSERKRRKNCLKKRNLISLRKRRDQRGLNLKLVNGCKAYFCLLSRGHLVEIWMENQERSKLKRLPSVSCTVMQHPKDCYIPRLLA